MGWAGPSNQPGGRPGYPPGGGPGPRLGGIPGTGDMSWYRYAGRDTGPRHCAWDPPVCCGVAGPGPGCRPRGYARGYAAWAWAFPAQGTHKLGWGVSQNQPGGRPGYPPGGKPEHGGSALDTGGYQQALTIYSGQSLGRLADRYRPSEPEDQPGGTPGNQPGGGPGYPPGGKPEHGRDTPRQPTRGSSRVPAWGWPRTPPGGDTRHGGYELVPLCGPGYGPQALRLGPPGLLWGGRPRSGLQIPRVRPRVCGLGLGFPSSGNPQIRLRIMGWG